MVRRHCCCSCPTFGNLIVYKIFFSSRCVSHAKKTSHTTLIAIFHTSPYPKIRGAFDEALLIYDLLPHVIMNSCHRHKHTALWSSRVVLWTHSFQWSFLFLLFELSKYLYFVNQSLVKAAKHVTNMSCCCC